MDLNPAAQYIQSMAGLNYFVPTNFYPTFVNSSFPNSQVTFIQTPEEHLNQITPSVMPINVTNSINVIPQQVFLTEKPAEDFKIDAAIKLGEERGNSILPGMMTEHVTNSRSIVPREEFHVNKSSVISDSSVINATSKNEKESEISMTPNEMLRFTVKSKIVKPEQNFSTENFSETSRSFLRSRCCKISELIKLKKESENLTPGEMLRYIASNIQAVPKENFFPEKSLGTSGSNLQPQKCKINALIKNKTKILNLIPSEMPKHASNNMLVVPKENFCSEKSFESASPILHFALIKNINVTGDSVSIKLNKTIEKQKVTHTLPKIIAEDNLQLRKSTKTYDRVNLKKNSIESGKDDLKEISESSKKFISSVDIDMNPEEKLEFKKSVKTYENLRKSFLCGICNKNFPSDQMLKNGDAYFCHTCHETIQIRTGLLQNTTLIDQKKENMCHICHDFFQNSACVIRHVKSAHHLGKLFLCDICSIQGSKLVKNVIFSHRKSHFSCPGSAETMIGESSRVSCKVCWKSFSRKEYLEIHIKTHLKKYKSYSCTLCKKKFPCAADLVKHRDQKHPKKKSFPCKLCHKVFTSSKYLIDHVNQHSGVTPYKCKHCDLSFTGSFRRNRHYRRQHCEKKFACEFCIKVFQQPAQLKRHVKRHLNIRPYKCDICSKAFLYRHALKKHCRSHTGEKPYVCDVCHKGFSIDYNYRVHCRIHTGEKPFVCEICNKAFRVKLILNEHYKTHKIKS